MELRRALRTLGWFCVIGGAAFGVQVWVLDRRMQAFRLPGGDARSYLFVPIRWQRALYRPEAGGFVDGAWQATRRMMGLYVLGMLLLAYAAE
jgi:hypothetical protein